jgi:hypothetical protein
MRMFTKLGAMVAIATATATVIRRYDLLNKGTALAKQGVAKANTAAEHFTLKAVGFTDQLLTKFDEATKAKEEQAKEEAKGAEGDGPQETTVTAGYGGYNSGTMGRGDAR